MTVEPSKLIELWMRLVEAWGGQTSRRVMPPAVAVGRIGMGMPDGRGFNHVMVAMSLDLLGPEQVRRALMEAAAGIRVAVAGWAGDLVGIAEDDFASVVCLTVEPTRPAWWAELQSRLGAQLLFLGRDEWEALAARHEGIREELFGPQALRLRGAESKLAELQQEILRLRADNKIYAQEYAQVASRRHRMNAAEAFHRSVIDLRHGLSADLYALHRRIKECRGRAPEQWPPDVFEALAGISRRLNERTRRMSARRTEPGPRVSIECGDLVRELEILGRQYGSTTRHREVPGGTVHVDREGLMECVTELISNACHWTASQKTALIRLTTQGCPLPGNAMALDVIVADNGPGVEDRFKADIFMPGTSLRNSTGRGLAMIALFCAEHGGEAFENGRFGAGARFILRLPVARP